MSSYGELPLPLQIFIPCFGVLFVIGLICSVIQMCMHPYGHYGHHGMGMGMMMGAGGMGMGGPMIAPSVSMAYSTMPMQPMGYAPAVGGVVVQQQQIPPPQNTATSSSESSSQAGFGGGGGYPTQSMV